MIWMLLLGEGDALASSADEMASAIIQDAAPPVLISCSSVGDVVGQVQSLMGQLGATSDASGAMMMAQMLLSPEMLRQNGLSLDEPMAVWMSSDQMHLLLPVAGGEDEHRAFLGRYVDPAQIAGAPPWSLAIPSGNTMQVTSTSIGDVTGLMLVASNEIFSAPETPVWPDLVEGLGEGKPGCLVYTAGLSELERFESSYMFSDKVTGAAVWLTFGALEMALRFHPQEPIGVALEGTRAPLPVVTSVEPPPIRMVLSVDALPVVLGSNTPWADQLPPERDIRKLKRRLSIPGGLALGLYSLDRETPSYAVQVPLARRSGRALPERKVWRVAERLFEPNTVNQEDSERFTVVSENGEVFGAVQSGRLFIATDASVRDEVLRGEGTPWFTADAQQRAQDWPLYAEALLPMMNSQMLAIGADISAGGDMVSLHAEMPYMSPERLRSILGTMLGEQMSAVGQALGQATSSGTSASEVHQQMAQLCAASRMNPRVMSEIEVAAVLGTAPAPGTRLWVEIEPEGAVVYGELSESGGTTRYRQSCTSDDGPVPVKD